MERTFWPEWPCSCITVAQFSRSGRQKCGSLENCGGQNVRAPWAFPAFKLVRTSSLWPVRMDKWKANSYFEFYSTSKRFFYKNNFIRTTRLKFGQKLRTALEQSRLGFKIIKASLLFLTKFYYFPQTRLYRALKYSKCWDRSNFYCDLFGLIITSQASSTLC